MKEQNRNSSILQDWITELPLKMQTVLCLGTRGTDTHQTTHVKTITKWLRGLIYKPGDPDNPQFMEVALPDLIQEKSPVAKELEFCTQHYYSHLMHTLEIVGYHHPDLRIALRAQALYTGMVRLFHLWPESKEDLDKRLGTKVWPGGQPKDFREAMQWKKKGDTE